MSRYVPAERELYEKITENIENLSYTELLIFSLILHDKLETRRILHIINQSLIEIMKTLPSIPDLESKINELEQVNEGFQKIMETETRLRQYVQKLIE
jgi:hypothetical protein